MKQTILCVDDEVDNVQALERLFRRKYKVLTATSGQEALTLLKKQNPVVIISDQRMPKMTGTEFLKKSLKTHPEAVRILLTGYTDIESVIDAINSGEIYRYITKPWEPHDLVATVKQAVEKHNLHSELEKKNKILNKALEDLKTLDQAKNDFMYLINHELKTPLTVLSSYVQILKETKTDKDQKLYLDKIENSTDKLSDLINDVLELVSAETGNKKLDLRRNAIKKVFAGIEVPYLELAKSKKMNFHFEIEEIITELDLEVIRKVLTRLIDNAVKFGYKGTQIELGAKKNKNKVQFFVRNQGPPIENKKIDKILSPFTLDEDFMNHTTGFGLGLSVSQALLHAHSSELKIQSKGDDFEVSFCLNS